MNSEDRRLELQIKLEEILGSDRVYFQPPANYKMKYPCFRYSWAGTRSSRANNLNYRNTRQYQVIYIDPDPTSEIPMQLLREFEMINHDRSYTADNLNHYVFTLYF